MVHGIVEEMQPDLRLAPWNNTRIFDPPGQQVAALRAMLGLRIRPRGAWHLRPLGTWHLGQDSRPSAPEHATH